MAVDSAPPQGAAHPSRTAATPAGAPPVEAHGGRIEGLDGIRALAILAVLVYHLRPASLPGGFLGVDVFFVVSGFLITTLLLRELRGAGRLDLPRFWVRRARRLVPALLAVVVVSIPVAWAASTDLLVGIGRQALGALTFSSNWLEVAAGSSYFTRTSPQLFVNFWSLAVEEQFYLFWPVVLAVLVALTATARTRVRVALAAAAGSALTMALLLVPGADATRVYFGTDTHLFGLMIGAALAFSWAAPDHGLLRSPRWLRWRGPATVLAAGGLVLLMLTLREDLPVTFRGGILLASLFSAVLVAALLEQAGPFRRLMTNPLLEWIGQRSYGLYLWHWPVICILVAFFPTAHDSAGHWSVRGAAVVVTVVLAGVSYRWLEQPVRRYGFRQSIRRAAGTLRGPSRRAGLVGVGATTVLALVTVLAIVQAPAKSATQLQIEAGQQQVAASGTAGTDSRPAQGAPLEAAPVDHSMPTGEEITIFGDSIVVTSADGLEARFPGVMLDAVSNRQWPDGEVAVRARLRDGGVRRAVVLDFGTNAGVREPAVVHRVLDALGEERMVVVVNLYGGSHWVPEANETLAAIVAEYPNAVIADWHRAISAQPELLQSDRIHPGIEGAHLYADVVHDALAELSVRLTGTAAR